MKTVTSVLVALLSVGSAFGQYVPEDFQAVLLKAKYGAMLVYNGQKNSFSIKFISKSFKPTDKENFVTVDDYIINSSIIPFQVEVDFDQLEESEQRVFLSEWKKYEKAWVEEQLKETLNEKEEFLTIGGRLFIYWSYDMPKSDDPDAVDKQVYLVSACFDQMLVLSGPVEKKKSEVALKDKLVGIAKTMEVYRGQVQNINKLYTDLMK